VLTAIEQSAEYAVPMIHTHTLRFMHSLALVILLTLASSGMALAGSDLTTITRVFGAVKISVAGRDVAVHDGAKLGLPAQIETGANGSLRVEQPSSTLDIGPNSTVLLPATNGKNEKVIQNLGRVLYLVKPRKARSFAVETPYLVSVVKGTMFSVAIEDGATSVSLLEGSVELVADGVDSVLLKPNESARHGANDRAIHITKIDTTPPVPPQASTAPATQALAGSTNDASFAPASEATFADLNEIASVRRDAGAGPSIGAPPTEAPGPGAPPSPSTPAPTPTPTPTPTPEVPAPTPPTVPMPTPDLEPDTIPMDDDCRRKKCDSDDDHDNGRGNDDDDDDDDDRDED
jgi:hypothetical protein